MFAGGDETNISDDLGLKLLLQSYYTSQFFTYAICICRMDFYLCFFKRSMLHMLQLLNDY